MITTITLKHPITFEGLELSDKAAAPLLASDKVKAAETKAATKTAGKAAAPLLASDKVKAAETKAATKTAGKAAAKDTEVTA